MAVCSRWGGSVSSDNVLQALHAGHCFCGHWIETYCKQNNNKKTHRLRLHGAAEQFPHGCPAALRSCSFFVSPCTPNPAQLVLFFFALAGPRICAHSPAPTLRARPRPHCVGAGTHTHTHILARVHTQIHMRTHAHMRAHIDMCTHACAHSVRTCAHHTHTRAHLSIARTQGWCAHEDGYAETARWHASTQHNMMSKSSSHKGIQLEALFRPKPRAADKPRDPARAARTRRETRVREHCPEA